MVSALWLETNIPTFASIHVPLLEAAVRDHLSTYGLTVLDALLEKTLTADHSLDRLMQQTTQPPTPSLKP